MLIFSIIFGNCDHEQVGCRFKDKIDSFFLKYQRKVKNQNQNCKEPKFRSLFYIFYMIVTEFIPKILIDWFASLEYNMLTEIRDCLITI